MTTLILLGIGGLMALVGTIIMIVSSFQKSLIWGLAVMFLPGGPLLFACVHWAAARAGFVAQILGVLLCFVGIYTNPEAQQAFWKAYNQRVPSAQAAPPQKEDIDVQIQEHRQRLETLQAQFAQDGVELTKEYQALGAQSKALKKTDTAAITKFNEAAAAYQARNAKRKEMLEEIDKAQKELDSLLDTKARKATPPATTGSERRVVMYTTSHCPACQAAKQYLAQRGISYDERDVETSRDNAEAFQKLGGRGVPLIFVGEKRMEGFSPAALNAAL